MIYDLLTIRLTLVDFACRKTRNFLLEVFTAFPFWNTLDRKVDWMAPKPGQTVFKNLAKVNMINLLFIFYLDSFLAEYEVIVSITVVQWKVVLTKLNVFALSNVQHIVCMYYIWLLTLLGSLTRILRAKPDFEQTETTATIRIFVEYAKMDYAKK